MDGSPVLDEDVSLQSPAASAPNAIVTDPSSNPSTSTSTPTSPDSSHQSPSYITFNGTGILGDSVEDRILTPDQNGTAKVEWRRNSQSLAVTWIAWMMPLKSDTTYEDNYMPISNNTITGPGKFLTSATNDSVVLGLAKYLNESHGAPMTGGLGRRETSSPPVVLKIGWTDPKANMSGNTTTGIFTVAKDKASAQPWPPSNSSSSSSSNDGNQQDPFEVTAPGALPIPYSASSNDSNSGTSSSSPAASSSPSHGSGSGGLSTGAIAGIAVGAAVGVILLTTILAIVFIRRRNTSRRRDSVDSVGGHRREIFREKEAYVHDTQSMDSPPRSPSAVDHGPPQIPPPTLVSSPNPSAVGVALTADSPRTFQGPTFNPHHPKPMPPAPPVERDVTQPAQKPLPPPTSRTTTASPIQRDLPQSSSAAKSTPVSPIERDLPQPPPPQQPLPPTPPQKAQQKMQPHGMSSSVAHLVEDGMTLEDIRRLEEEERALDDAIALRGN